VPGAVRVAVGEHAVGDGVAPLACTYVKVRACLVSAKDTCTQAPAGVESLAAFYSHTKVCGSPSATASMPSCAAQRVGTMLSLVVTVAPSAGWPASDAFT